MLLHIVGFAVTFGAWVTQAASRQFRTTRTMDYGLLVSLLTGLALAAPWPAGVDLNYPKIAVKLGILVILGGVLGMGVMPVNAAPATPSRSHCSSPSACCPSRPPRSPCCGDLSLVASGLLVRLRPITS